MVTRWAVISGSDQTPKFTAEHETDHNSHPIDSPRSPPALAGGRNDRCVSGRGGVATAEHPAGEAEELPWKAFTARG